MGKGVKARKNYHKKKKFKTTQQKAETTVSVLEALDFKQYVERIKALKKFSDSIEYLRTFSESLDDESVIWKFKSNLQTFIKKHILMKSIFNSASFSDFQQYFFKMAGKTEFVKQCEEIVRKITENDKKIIYDLLILKIKPLNEDEYTNLAEKIKKRCVILIENSN